MSHYSRNSSRNSPRTSRPQSQHGQYHRGAYYPNHGQQQRTNPTPPPQNKTRCDEPYIQWLFDRVDTDGNGTLDAAELQRALSNGAGTPFNPDTVQLMIGMFDKRRDGNLNRREFGALWKYVSEWCNTFRRFDTDSSGDIDKDELKRCLVSFGYRLTDHFYDTLITRFDRTKNGQLNFDDFLQLCIMLQTLTQAFKEKDTSRKGKVVVTYEDFLLMVFSAKI